METKNQKISRKKAFSSGKISLRPDEEISVKISKFLRTLRENEIRVSVEKILKFVLKGVNISSIARKMISNKKALDEIIKSGRQKAAALWG